MKLIPFLNKAIFFPSSFISKGNVMVPIMVNVTMKAATAVTEAPLSRSDAPKGNEIRDGICMIAPDKARRSTPLNPDCSPAILEISLGGTNPNNKPIKSIIIRTVGIMRMNDFSATMSDRFVFALSLIKATIKQMRAKIFIKIAAECIYIPHIFISMICHFV